eukprot:scaffold12379_cov59-Phaeocystis_antarctica.AAC.1
MAKMMADITPARDCHAWLGATATPGRHTVAACVAARVAARVRLAAASEAWGLQRAWLMGSHYHYLLTAYYLPGRWARTPRRK